MVYERWKKRRGSVTAADAYYQRSHRRAERDLPPDDRFQLGYIFSREKCYHTAKRIRSVGGDAAGVDRTRLSQLTNGNLGTIAELLSKAVPAGGYRPGRSVRFQIRKPGGGTRELRIPTFIDRIAASRLRDALAPVIEPSFRDLSYGFRPARSTWDLLAALKVAAERQDRWVLAVCDVRKAFDSIQIADAINSFQALFRGGAIGQCSERTRSKLLELIGLILQGGDDARRTGIGTGCPFSPLALNVHLHVNHDLFFTEENTKSFLVWDGDVYRYVDNLIYLTRDVTDGHRVLENIRTHLTRCQLRLKDDADVFDLRERGPNLLGFEARSREGKLVFGLHQESLDRLSITLERAHEDPNPPLAARQAVLGWIGYMGPAFESGWRLVPRILQVMTDHGFRESVERIELTWSWHQAHLRWCNRMLS